MRRFSILGTLFLILVLVAGFSWLGLKLIGRSFLPDGESGGVIPELSAEATITRDQYGVAYIDAADESDAMAALGYAHAQDRLWQMDVMRRAGQGRLSEIFGRTTVAYDELLRTIGFMRTAKEITKAMPQKARTALAAYCSGVNAFIEEHRGHYPLEFDALGYEPEPWLPEHSVLVTRLLAWELNTSFWTDIVFGELERHVDSLRFSQILPYYPSDAPTVIPGGQQPEPLLEQLKAPPPDTTRRDSSALADSAAQSRDTLPRAPGARPARPGRAASLAPAVQAMPDMGAVMDMEREMRRFLGINGAHIGSNAWAISGKRTTSGRAMLANDPHLTHTAPSRWFQIVMRFGDRRIAGVTLPGLPYVVIGRNDRVAWGLTSLMADETDFYIEKLDSTRRTTMLVDDRWEKLTVLRDTIRVKDSASVPFMIRIGRHGPIISELHPFSKRKKGERDVVDSASFLLNTAVAMRWTGNTVSQEISALQGINSARNLQEFTAAARLGGIPSLSFVYADTGGTIACVPVARIPIREGTRTNAPNSGWESRYDWKGTMSPDKLPTLVNPQSGYVASANNKLANNLGFNVGDLWEDPSRAIRLEELLREGDNFSLTDFVQMQADLVSPHMLYLRDFLLRAFPDSTKQGTAVQKALGMLRRWNGGMVADAPEAAIAAQWLQTTIEMTYMDEMGPDLYRRYVYSAQQPLRALRYHAMIDSRWFDDIRTKDRTEMRDDILRKALGRALDSLHARFDANEKVWEIEKWRFGPMHTLTFAHPFDADETLRGIVNIGPFEIGGSNTTLNNGEWDLNEPFKVRVGPSMRQIVDFSDTAAFLRSVITSGASGQPLNSFYKNQTVLWTSNGYLVLEALTPTGSDISSVTRLTPREE